MKICIGIISGLPEDTLARRVRFSTLNNLVKKCDYLFDLPITIVAQNWQNCKLDSIHNNLTLLKYKNLMGITQARKILREWYINSEYDYMIMFDDDCDFIWDKYSAQSFIESLIKNPDKWYSQSTLLKCSAISKKIYKEIPYPNLESSKGEFYDDIWLITILENKYSVQKIPINLNIIERSNSCNDKYSTWYRQGIDKDLEYRNTIKLVKRYLEGELKCT